MALQHFWTEGLGNFLLFKENETSKLNIDVAIGVPALGFQVHGLQKHSHTETDEQPKIEKKSNCSLFYLFSEKFVFQMSCFIAFAKNICAKSMGSGTLL